MKSLAVLFILIFISFNSFSQSTDTLVTKRVFVTTVIYRNGFKLPHKRVKSLYKDTWQPRVKYNWGFYNAPVGTVVAAAGIGIAAIALKGTPATAMLGEKEVKYKVRSLPKLLIGIGIATGGICLIESANGLIQSSVDIYNARQNNLRNKTSFIQKVNMGITESNGVGLTVRF